MTAAIIGTIIIIALITWVTLWVTRKAYSRKWEEE